MYIRLTNKIYHAAVEKIESLARVDRRTNSPKSTEWDNSRITSILVFQYQGKLGIRSGRGKENKAFSTV